MAVSVLEIREADDDLVLSGYASTFSQPYDMGWYSEQVDPKAFNRTLSQKPDVQLLINHDGLPLARTTAPTALSKLDLSADNHGLLAQASLDRTDPDVQKITPKLRSGILNSMSFGFRIVPDLKGEPGDVWSPDMSSRTLRTIDLDGGDVSVVTNPANPNTSVGLRAGGNALEAIASAMRTMEARSASDEEIRALLGRMQAAYGETTSGDELAIQEVVSQVDALNTSEMDEAVRIAREILNLRKRRSNAL